VYANPKVGAMIAVSEAARNIVCSGGEPLGVTNCLNFGNPYDPEVYYQFVEAIQGMGDACRKFDTPVTGGNVSFYNQNPDGPVNPTPTIGMVGLVGNVKDKMTLDFKKEGDRIFLLGNSYNDLGCSEYLHQLKGVSHSPAPHFDIEEEFTLQQAVKSLIANKLIDSAHDVSEGGLITTLLEKGFNRSLGFEVNANLVDAVNNNIRVDAYWFGESQSRVVVTVAEKNMASFKKSLESAKIKFTALGVVTNGAVKVDAENWGSITDFKQIYNTAIASFLSKENAGDALSAI
jgi:phosphoribosylformylglycinamidine synthase